jgi:gliding motility-associated-like protein
MRRFLFVILLCFVVTATFANHTKGGWMYYEYIGAGDNLNTLKYRITLKLYTICELNSGQFNPTISFSIFDAATNLGFSTVSVTYTNDPNIQNCTTQECHPCINSIPTICYKIITYERVVDLPISVSGYIVAYQRCCRITGIQNIQAPSNSVGETWTVKIPGTAVPGAETNSSARFSQNDTAIICEGNSFVFDFSATDVDNDSLVYSFTPAYGGASNTDPAPASASNPPYSSVPYANGFSGSQPMGSGVHINPVTGFVTGIAPLSGIYVLTVTVSEYRRGTNIKVAEVRKSLHIEVANCSLTEAKLDPEYTSCDGFTVDFFNHSTANIQTYDWDFGDNSTSNQAAPTHTYADTGIYILKLVVNRGLPCSDSATAPVKVYPGFHPGFTMNGQCKNIPVLFSDNTVADYGMPFKWDWNFGDPSSASNTSILQNPTHIYTTTGTYTVTLKVASDKGCENTISKTIDIVAQPPLTLAPKDTLICTIDTLQLNAVGSGSFLWSPNYMISNVNIPDPLVSPDVTTTYRVTITDAFGCAGSDTIRVRVVNNVTQFGNYDTTICRTDPAVLRLNSDALHFLWTESPANNTLNNPTIKNPTATPLVTTNYHVVGNIGKCIAENDIKVTPIPYPAADAGPDQTICFGGSAQLNASGGSIYNWSPTAFLTASNIPNPVSIKPTDNIRYIVTVRDVLGCPKPVKDTLILFVSKIKASAGPSDTSVVLDQPLQLGASGGTNYSWTPSTWLNDPTIHNPIALPRNDITYRVRVSDNIGCFDDASIRVHVFFIKPDLLVPNAFTPNGDNLNNIFKPIPIGLKSVDIFRVYNRWGQMLYSGTGNGSGWDGTFGGVKQETAAYVWYAEGVDYLNNKIKRKGTVILIR